MFLNRSLLTNSRSQEKAHCVIYNAKPLQLLADNVTADLRSDATIYFELGSMPYFFYKKKKPV